ncbi:MAG: HNH/ENDO VII family nuclease [Sulfurimonas sp.]|uniref:HNH/ENDO VII family nuclease n=1 Tax=Sulfurimonas sp. TaxID=2022749 RepID=UPI00262AAE19|nr:HNH/ENDO VII family nuclease [Sulfurimonas sp.]MDD5373275.1 HNH/ENDO VII family nuclease [Sulfurimonas sp.]
MKFILNLLLIVSLLFGSQLNAGIFKNTARLGLAIGAVKAYKVAKEKKLLKKTKKSMNGTFEKITTKNIYAPNGERTVYQREINPDLAVKDKYGNEIKNLDRMKKGKAPYVEKNGNIEKVELHHIKQNDNGSLAELSKSTHGIKDSEKGAKALHPYGNKKNPDNPISKERTNFDKERSEYYKQRAKGLLDE